MSRTGIQTERALHSQDPHALRKTIEPAATKPQVQRALGALEEVVADVGNRVSDVTQRLSPVLSPQPPTPEDATDRGSCGVEMADEITRFAVLLQGISDKLAELMQRIEA